MRVANAGASRGLIRLVALSALPFMAALAAGQAYADNDEQALRLHIVIKDTGPGIPVEEIPHLFEVFTRGRESTGHPDRGAGIGLPIAHRLSQAMGGSLTIESTAGAGTTVRLELPLSLPQ